MKKSNLITGFIYLIAGVGIGPGLMIIFKYFYWNKPENKPGQSIVYRNTIDCPDYFYIRKITRKMLDTFSPLLPLSSCRPWQPK